MDLCASVRVFMWKWMHAFVYPIKILHNWGRDHDDIDNYWQQHINCRQTYTNAHTDTIDAEINVNQFSLKLIMAKTDRYRMHKTQAQMQISWPLIESIFEVIWFSFTCRTCLFMRFTRDLDEMLHENKAFQWGVSQYDCMLHEKVINVVQRKWKKKGKSKAAATAYSVKQALVSDSVSNKLRITHDNWLIRAIWDVIRMWLKTDGIWCRKCVQKRSSDLTLKLIVFVIFATLKTIQINWKKWRIMFSYCCR